MSQIFLLIFLFFACTMQINAVHLSEVLANEQKNGKSSNLLEEPIKTLTNGTSTGDNAESEHNEQFKFESKSCEVSIRSRGSFSEIAYLECDDETKCAIENGKLVKCTAQDEEEIPADVREKFIEFQKEFNRYYQSDEEEEKHIRIFKKNLQTIDELNKEEKGTAKYGLTNFADHTEEQHSERKGLLRQGKGHKDKKYPNHEMAKVPNVDIPKNFDWRDHNGVSRVKNQDRCGSCWAFSLTGVIEGLYAKLTGNLVTFSEQQLVDCDLENDGCNGGWRDKAVRYIMNIGGLQLESSYPYKARRTFCHSNSSLNHVQLAGYVEFGKNSEDDMARWLYANGPISISLNTDALVFYKGGIIHPSVGNCRPDKKNHAVLLVGYGVEYTTDSKGNKIKIPYWIGKNSWGTGFGEDGFFRIYRGENVCGLAEEAASLILKHSSVQ